MSPFCLSDTTYVVEHDNTIRSLPLYLHTGSNEVTEAGDEAKPFHLQPGV